MCFSKHAHPSGWYHEMPQGTEHGLRLGTWQGLQAAFILGATRESVWCCSPSWQVTFFVMFRLFPSKLPETMRKEEPLRTSAGRDCRGLAQGSKQKHILFAAAQPTS